MLLKVHEWVLGFVKNLVKNFLILALCYALAEWVLSISDRFYQRIWNVILWTNAQNTFIFAIVWITLLLIFVLLGLFPVTQIWVFKVKRDAKKRSYFSILYPLEKGGYAYGFVHSKRINKDLNRIYEAVLFWGGYSRIGFLEEKYFYKINLSIPEVILHAYVAPWLPSFLSKHLNEPEIIPWDAEE